MFGKESFTLPTNVRMYSPQCFVYDTLEKTFMFRNMVAVSDLCKCMVFILEVLLAGGETLEALCLAPVPRIVPLEITHS